MTTIIQRSLRARLNQLAGTACLLLLPGAIAIAGACGTSAPPQSTSGDSCVDYTVIAGSASFSSDVMPIFQRACNYDSCHSSDSSNPQEGLKLGKPSAVKMTATEISTVRQGIVNRPSVRSSLVTVAPGDPAASWLVAKIEYESFNDCPLVSSKCTGKGCGGQMPQTMPPLSLAERDIIVKWVKNGANDD